MFRKKKPQNLPTTPTEYPTGIAIKSENATYYLAKDNKRYKIDSQRIQDSWRFPFVVNSTEAALVNYPVALGKLGFRDGSLLNNIADGKVYLVSGSRLRHVVSVDVLERMGLSMADSMLVSQSDIDIMKRGEDIK